MPKNPQNISKYPKMPKNISKYLKISQNVPKFPQIPPNSRCRSPSGLLHPPPPPLPHLRPSGLQICSGTEWEKKNPKFWGLISSKKPLKTPKTPNFGVSFFLKKKPSKKLTPNSKCWGFTSPQNFPKY